MGSSSSHDLQAGVRVGSRAGSRVGSPVELPATLRERMARIEGRVQACVGGRIDAHVGAHFGAHFGAHVGGAVHEVFGSPTVPAACTAITASSRCVPTGWAQVDAALGGGLARCGLHEWRHDDDQLHARCAPMQAFIHLAWQALLHDERHCPGMARRVVWVGRAVWPCAEALVRGMRVGVRAMFGQRCPRLWPDARLVRQSLLVDDGACGARAERGACGARLWAIEQAVRCPGVCAVIADGAGFDLAATRRLQLAAADALLLVARPHERRPTLSAASTRWRVRAEPSGALPASLAELLAARTWRVPPEPACVVELERIKGRGGGTMNSADTAVCITHAWQWQGADQPPKSLVAEAERRRKKKDALLAARAAQALAQRRREEHESHVIAANYPLPADHAMLSGDHAAGVGDVVRRSRRARRAR